MLVQFCRGVFYSHSDDPDSYIGFKEPTPCPVEYKKRIEEKGILQPKTETVQELDVSVLLLEAVGYGFLANDPKYTFSISA